jgi:hypothetical protein
MSNYVQELQDAVVNAQETLYDALDDTSALGALDIADLRRELTRAEEDLEEALLNESVNDACERLN